MIAVYLYFLRLSHETSLMLRWDTTLFELYIVYVVVDLLLLANAIFASTLGRTLYRLHVRREIER
jgi:hypothetical protein